MGDANFCIPHFVGILFLVVLRLWVNLHACSSLKNALAK